MQLNLTIRGCVIDDAARGSVRYYNRMDDPTTLGHSDALVASLLKRYGLSGTLRVKRL